MQQTWESNVPVRSLRGIANYNQYQWMIPPPDYNHKDNYGLLIPLR